MSREGREREVAKLVEDFLAKLAKVLSSYERQEYSIEDMEMQKKGLVSFLGALSQRWSLLIIFLLYMRGMNFNEPRELAPRNKLEKAGYVSLRRAVLQP